MPTIEIITHGLYVRSAPAIATGNIVATLLQGQDATVDTYTPDRWLHTTFPNEGYLYAGTAYAKLIAGPIPLPVPVPGGDNATSVVIVNTDILNVRARPSTSAAILATIPRGTAITVYSHHNVLAEGHNWYQIAVASPEQWIAGDLTVNAPAPLPAPTPPPVPVPQPPAPPAPVPVGFQLPMSAQDYGGHANPGGWSVGSAEAAVFQRNHMTYALIAAFQRNQALIENPLAVNNPPGTIAVLRSVGVRDFIIRACVSGGASAGDFLSITLPIMKQYAAAIGGQMLIQLGNEPNLVAEGWTRFWGNGQQFSQWWLQIAAVYRSQIPNIKIGFAPMSPGGSAPGIRLDESLFMADCKSAIAVADFGVVHNYWVASDGSDLKVPVAMWREQLPGKALIIGESGPGDVTVVTAQAVQHAHSLYAANNIPATFYIVDGSGFFPQADWLRNNIQV